MSLDDRLLKPIPPQLALRIKLTVAIPACAAVGVCAWLYKLIGMHPATLFITAVAIAHFSARALAPLALRFTRGRPGYLRDSETSRRVGIFGVLVTIGAIWFVEYFAARALHVPHPGTADDPLYLQAPLSALLACGYLGMLFVEVAYSTTAARTRAGRKAGRDGTTAVVMVHGIGNQRAGSTVRPLASSLEQILYRQAPDRVRVIERPASGGAPAYIEFGYSTRHHQKRQIQRVVMFEAFWANLKPRSNSPRTFGWLLRSLPLLILLSIAPDYSDINGRSLRRILYRISYVTLLTLSILQPSVRILSVGLLAALFMYTVFFRTNLIGDIRLAAANENAVEEITASINEVIDQAFSMASKVIVIGHSQGGYLSLRAIRARDPASPGELEFIGVGSGLKPIWLLHEFGRKSFIVGTALLVGLGLMLVSLMPVAVGLVQWSSAWFQHWLPSAVKSLVVAPDFTDVHPVGDDWRLLLPISFSDPLAPVPDWWQAALFAAGAAIVLVVRWKARPHLRRLQETGFSRPEALDRWIEISTSADSVGRLAFPRLSGAEIYESTGLGNPVLDHTSYFRPSSPASWFISGQLFSELLEKPIPAMRQWAHYLNERAWQVRRFTANLGLLVLIIYIFDRLPSGGRGLRELTVQMRHPGWTFAVFIGLTVLTPLLALCYQFAFTRAIDRNPIKAPPKVKVVPAKNRVVLFMAWFYCAAWVGVSSHFPVAYGSLSPTEARLLPVAPILIAILFFVFAAALEAGYRPSWWTWAVTFALAGYWWTYLPGQGGAYLLMVAFYAVIAGVVTVLVYRSSVTENLPDEFWPTPAPRSLPVIDEYSNPSECYVNRSVHLKYRRPGPPGVEAHGLPALPRQGRNRRRVPRANSIPASWAECSTALTSRRANGFSLPSRCPRPGHRTSRPCAPTSPHPSKSTTLSTPHASTHTITRKPSPRGSPKPHAKLAPPTLNSSANNWSCSSMARQPVPVSSTPTPSPPPPLSPPSSSTTPSSRQPGDDRRPARSRPPAS
jgi:hypothetical protein